MEGTETNEAWLFQIILQSKKQERNHSFMIKRLFGEHITSRLVKTQNRELCLRCIAYNMHRLTNLVIILMVSTEPLQLQDTNMQI